MFPLTFLINNEHRLNFSKVILRVMTLTIYVEVKVRVGSLSLSFCQYIYIHYNVQLIHKYSCTHVLVQFCKKKKFLANHNGRFKC